MQPICNLANTGTNIALIIAAAFGVIAIASLILYQLKTGKAFSKGFFALLLVFGIIGTLVLSPAATHAATTDCPNGSQATQSSVTCPENWVVVPGNSAYNTTDFCVMKYTAKQAGATVTSSFDMTLSLFTDSTWSTGGTWSIQLSGSVNTIVGPFPYNVDAETVAAALEAVIGETVTTNDSGVVENASQARFYWTSPTDDWQANLDLTDLEQDNGPGLYNIQIDADDNSSASGGIATSQAASTPWVNISQTDAIAASQAAAPGAHLITENEWMTIAHNVLANPANWCDADGSNCGNAPGTSGKVLASGHNDSSPNMPLESSIDDSQACYGTVTQGVNTACGSEAGTQKRTLTLSNGSVLWDLVGNVGHWTASTETLGNLPSFSGNGGPLEYNLDSGFGLSVVDTWGTLAYTNPAIQNPAAASWGAGQGVGLLGSDFSSGSSTVVAFVRGGTWGDGPGAGAFTLYLVYTPSVSGSRLGFRAAL